VCIAVNDERRMWDLEEEQENSGLTESRWKDLVGGFVGKRSVVGIACLVSWCCLSPHAVVQALEHPGMLHTKIAGWKALHLGC
jgi:hypothetical protein